ncbi:hypothetical protein EJB05_06991, partial [Eragrostis curvula]
LVGRGTGYKPHNWGREREGENPKSDLCLPAPPRQTQRSRSQIHIVVAYRRLSAMADPVAAASHLSGCPAWVLLESFGTFGDSENATTASSLTSSGSKVKLSFELVDPPGVSRWFVDCPGPKKERFNGRPFILNAAGSLIVLRMAFLREERSVFDYFVFRAGPGEPKLDLIPGPYPKASLRKRVGVLPLGAGEHYLMVFPTPQLKPQGGYEIQIFSSDNGAWSTKVARVSTDPETTFHEMAMHHPSKAIAAGGNSLAWVDLWRGILLCEQLDSEEPVLRLIKWPVPSPCQDIVDMYSAHGSRDATLSNGVIRFLEMKFHHADDACHSTDGMGIGWTATVWKRMSSSKDWKVCFKADIAKILATHLNSSDLLQKVRDDTLKKLDLTKVATAPPTLSLTDEDVVYFMANLVSDEALLLAVNGRVKKLEAVEQTTFELPCSPCPFYSLPDASPGFDIASPFDNGMNWENMEHVETYLAAALNDLMHIGKHTAFKKPWHNKIIPLISSGGSSSSSLHTNVEAVCSILIRFIPYFDFTSMFTPNLKFSLCMALYGFSTFIFQAAVAEYFCTNRQSNSMNDAVGFLGELLRMLGDLESRILAPIEEMKFKVSFVLVAFDKFKNGDTSGSRNVTDVEHVLFDDIN